jgi:Putative auto-transporter adhesin, head GIN domain
MSTAAPTREEHGAMTAPSRFIALAIRFARTCLATLLVGSALSACGATHITDITGFGRIVTGSGHVVSRHVRVTSFSKLEVSNAFVVRVSLGSTEQATVRVDDNVVADLDVHVSGDTLHVGLSTGTSARDVTLEADVTARSLSAIDGSGAAKITLRDPLSEEQLAVTLSGASSLTAELKISDGTVGISGASGADLTGTASALQVTASGASHLSGRDLTIGSLSIDLSGASQAEATVTGSISAVATGASTLIYAGTPAVTREDVSGASQITPIG